MIAKGRIVQRIALHVLNEIKTTKITRAGAGAGAEVGAAVGVAAATDAGEERTAAEKEARKVEIQILNMIEIRAPEIGVEAGAIPEVRDRNLPNLTETENSGQNPKTRI